MTRASLTLSAVALLAPGLVACGRAGTGAGSASNASSTAPSLSGLLGDQDSDTKVGGYYDSDDGEVRSYGHEASATEARAITTLVERYYAAAAAQDATKACALTYYLEAETLPEQYAEPPGPRWLHGASTCRAVLSRVFAHFHSKLTVPVVVTAVRVNRGRAEVLVGFKTLPAGYVKARLEGATWKIDSLLAAPLP
jgi:hypothetical protein